MIDTAVLWTTTEIDSDSRCELHGILQPPLFQDIASVYTLISHPVPHAESRQPRAGTRRDNGLFFVVFNVLDVIPPLLFRDVATPTPHVLIPFFDVFPLIIFACSRFGVFLSGLIHLFFYLIACEDGLGVSWEDPIH